MPTVSVCYALQSVPENINIKKKNFTTNHLVSVQYTKNISDVLYQASGISISHSIILLYAETKYTAISVLCFLLPLGRCLCLVDCQSPRVFTSPVAQYFATGPNKRYITLKTYNIKSLEIHKLKENLPRAKLCPLLILALFFRSFRLFVLYQSFNIFQLLQNRVHSTCSCM